MSFQQKPWNEIQKLNKNILGRNQLEQCLSLSLPFVSWGVLFHQVKLVETLFPAPALPSLVPAQHSNEGTHHVQSSCPGSIEHLLSGSGAGAQPHGNIPVLQPVAPHVLPVPIMVCHTNRSPGQSLAKERWLLVLNQPPHLLTWE